MSIDAALMQNPSRTATPTFRIYQWQPRCISLGYHQSDLPIHIERCRRECVDVVRRPTGGRAVFHSDEVTYAVVIPRDSEWYSRSKQDLYRVISTGIAQGLINLGFPVNYARSSAKNLSSSRASASVSCFSSTTRWEITLDGRKLVGSAQRLTMEGFLQHGSILTGKSHSRLMDFFLKSEDLPSPGKTEYGRNAISIEEFSGHKIAPQNVSDALKNAWEKAFSVRFRDGALTEEEMLLADSSRRRYSVFSSKESNPR
jgi:lipoate-protein ligase A